MSDVLDSLHPTLRDLPGTTLLDRYEIDEVLGLGGMGAVFRGRHLGLKREVAVKVLHPDLTRDPEISARFDREAHSASRLDHPNCLRVTDVGSTEDGVKFMVMDLLSGGELADRLGEPMVPERAVLMILQVLRGLEHAHEHGVIHRDVKPENIFITRDHDGREVLKLVDFGIAKLVGGGTNDTRMTKAGLIFGTPAYMSPEQAMGMEADGRADLYAVGVILYEMLGGSPPFESDDPVKLVRMQVSKDPPPLPENVAPTLSAVVMKLMAKDRDERFQSATEARETLELVLPAVASSEIISGATLLGSSITGPILLAPPGSGPIPVTGSNSVPIVVQHSDGTSSSVSGAVPIQHPSGAFSPSALPTLPPQSGLRAGGRDWRRMAMLGGGGLLSLLLLVWISSGDDDPPGASSEQAGAAEADGSNPAKADDDGEVLMIEDDGPESRRLKELDGLISASNLVDAQKVLDGMLDEYPQSGALQWRQGRLWAKTRKRKNLSKALVAYGDAIDANPALLENHDFYAEIYQLFGESRLRSESLDLALRKMGPKGHKFLLEQVNNEKKPLGYTDRRRALQELSTVEESKAAIANPRLHVALDLLQATQSLTPCAAYADALEVIASAPDYWFYPRVQRANPPKVNPDKELTADEQADAVRCEGLEERRAEVLAQLEALEPNDSDGEEIMIDGDEEDPPPSGTGGSSAKKSGGGSGGSSGSASKPKKSGGSAKPNCNNKFAGGIFNKKCR